jgi:hypothetical protein
VREREKPIIELVHKGVLNFQSSRMEVKMAVLDNTRHQIFTDGHKTCFKALILVIAFLCSAIASRGEEARPPGSSQPPDTTQYRRPAIPMDRAVARQIRPTVRGRLHAPSPNLLPNPTLLKLVDVNASAPRGPIL